MVLPESLILDSYERVDKIFRHILVFYDLTVLGVVDIIYLLTFIVIDDRRSIYCGIYVFVVVMRTKGNDTREVDEQAKYHSRSKYDKITEQHQETELVFAILVFSAEEILSKSLFIDGFYLLCRGSCLTGYLARRFFLSYFFLLLDRLFAGGLFARLSLFYRIVFSIGLCI